MVSYNAQEFIESAMQSVLAQSYPYIEFIIVDGASKDKTLAIIDRYKNKIDHVISESDRGVYDAMNKGLKMASGDIIYFLNTDDCFYDPQVIENIILEFERHPKADLIIGKLMLTNQYPHPVRNFSDPFEASVMTKHQLFKYGMCHQRIFTKKHVFDATGFFDIKYKICADFKWFLSCLTQRVSMEETDTMIVYYNHQGLSSRSVKTLVKEKTDIILKNTSALDLGYYIFQATLRRLLS